MGLTTFIFAKKDYIARDGRVPVYLGVLQNGKTMPPIKLKGIRVMLEHWNDESSPHQVKKSHPDHYHINTEILNAAAKAQKIIRKYEVLERVLTYDRFMKEWGGFNPCDLEQFVKDYIKGLQSARNEKTGKPMYSESYIEKVGLVMGKVFRWRPNLDIQDIDVKLINDYKLHLASLGNKENTIYSNMKIFRRIMKEAYDQELINRNPFDKVKLRRVKVQVIPLELPEVKKYEQVLSYDLPYYLHKTLCWFLLAIYTGRRYGDIENFEQWTFYRDYIKLVQDKSVAGIQDQKIVIIWINDRIRRVVDLIREKNYKPLSNQKANDFLKELTSLVGIDKRVTFHLARHTFNHINKKLRTDAVTRQELLGHDRLRSTQYYEKPDSDQMKEAMQKWNNA